MALVGSPPMRTWGDIVHMNGSDCLLAVRNTGVSLRSMPLFYCSFKKKSASIKVRLALVWAKTIMWFVIVCSIQPPSSFCRYYLRTVPRHRSQLSVSVTQRMTRQKRLSDHFIYFDRSLLGTVSIERRACCWGLRGTGWFRLIPTKNLLVTFSVLINLFDVVWLTMAQFLTCPRLRRFGDAKVTVQSFFIFRFACWK